MDEQRGLFNLGNTCYLNSAIQALRHAKPFTDYFGTDAWKTHSHPTRPGYELAQATAGLLAEFKKSDTALAGSGSLPQRGSSMQTPVNPKPFVAAFLKVAKERDLDDEFHFGAQADGTEAVLLILQVLHEQQARHVQMEISGVPKSPSHKELVSSLENWSTFFQKEYSPIVEAVYGQTQAKRVCTCGATRVQYEPWGVLKLPIPNADKQGAPAPTLQQCISANFASETLDDYTCDTCKTKGTTRTESRVSRFPSHMILGLKRYTNAGAKVRARIPYDPNCIDFSEWVTWPSLQRECKYKVYAVIDQHGSSRGGHYTMRARNSDSWTLYDDQQHSKAENGDCSHDTLMLFLERL